MKKDINFEPVTGVKIAIAKEMGAAGEEWSVYLINLNFIEIQTVMITSKGYGEINGEPTKTSTLRHVIEKVESRAIAKIEPIDPKLFELNNEFWVSYYILDQIFDKKFIFTSGSMIPANMTFIEELGLEVVLHT